MSKPLPETLASAKKLTSTTLVGDTIINCTFRPQKDDEKT